jgi:hypothetical protein
MQQQQPVAPIEHTKGVNICLCILAWVEKSTSNLLSCTPLACDVCMLNGYREMLGGVLQVMFIDPDFCRMEASPNKVGACSMARDIAIYSAA